MRPSETTASRSKTSVDLFLAAPEEDACALQPVLRSCGVIYELDADGSTAAGLIGGHVVVS